MKASLPGYVTEARSLFESALDYTLPVSKESRTGHETMFNGINNEWNNVRGSMQSRIEFAGKGQTTAITTKLKYMDAMINGPYNIKVIDEAKRENVNDFTETWGFASKTTTGIIPANIAGTVRDFARFPCWISVDGSGDCRGSFGVGFMLLCYAEGMKRVDPMMRTNDDFVFSFTGALHMRLSFGHTAKAAQVASAIANLLDDKDNDMTLAPFTRQHLRAIANSTKDDMKANIEKSLADSFRPVFNYNNPQ